MPVGILRRVDVDPAPPAAQPSPRWLTRGVAGIGVASFLSDLGHEVPTALLPSFLTTTIGAPAAALGLIEGVADGAAGVAKLAGGALADDPQRRRATAVGGYTVTAVLSSLIGAATSTVQVGLLRAGAWAARGLRQPSRNALLAETVPEAVYGRAYGFERAMDNLGAILGPLLALLLVALTSVRTAILLSVIPGLLATVAMVDAIRHTQRPVLRERTPLRIRIRPVLRGRLGRLLLAVGALELGNVAATLMILRATELLEPSRGHDRAVEIGLLLYVGYNLSATLSSVPGGRLGDRRGPTRTLAAGAGAFLFAYVLLGVSGPSVPLLAAGFVLAGVGIGFVETGENTAVARYASEDLRGSAFGFLAALQSVGNLVASGVAGILWTVVSPGAAFAWAAGWMALSLLLIVGPVRSERS
jgi:MFS family permease